MGTIIIEGTKVDTEDIDLLVRHKPLSELDGLIKADKEMKLNDPYWKHRIETHRIARDIAQWCWDNDIPTIDLPKKERDRTQGLYALQKCRELESQIRQTRTDQKAFQQYVLDKLNSLSHTLLEIKKSTVKKKRVSKYD